ncbi:hypothetical protein AB0K34_18630 [Actinomadura sp. NPDC049382]|uniref:hypothetical protein n=1 Tax=Actinomadura sp. NPDC049382 TaxID=3158220 RepID=UPI00342D8EC9
MFDQQARIERVLVRHPGAVVVEPLPGRPALIRRDEILVAGRDAGAAENVLRRWSDARHDEYGVSRLRLRAPAKVDVCEVAAMLAAGVPGRGARSRGRRASARSRRPTACSIRRRIRSARAWASSSGRKMILTVSVRWHRVSNKRGASEGDFGGP